ncbi:MAG: pyridoxal-phosphate dependent enzyme [Pseudomonadota bacterium]
MSAVPIDIPKPLTDLPPPDVEALRRAQAALAGNAHVTPVATSATLDAAVNACVHMKCENLQRVGAFKFRGAYNAVSQLTDAEREGGLLTFSSGNHGQAMALVGKLFSADVTVVMPHNAPEIKTAAVRGYGARVVQYDPQRQVREELAAELLRERPYTIIPPYDHPNVIAGQGTVALELFEQAPPLDALLVCVGGGGLVSGCALAAKHVAPECKVIGIEPELADDATRSFHTGTLHGVTNPPTIADGTRTPSLGYFTFPLVREYVADMRTVTEEAIADAVRFLFYRSKLVVEPAGALGVAALMSGVVSGYERVGVILSGGNMDGPTAAAILSGRSPSPPE